MDGLIDRGYCNQTDIKGWMYTRMDRHALGHQAGRRTDKWIDILKNG
jgi:hypothetical protein